MGFEYAILVKNKTRLETLKERFNTTAQAKFYTESRGGDFSDYLQEHERFHDSFNLVQRSLSQIIKNKIVERQFLPNYLFSEKNFIVVVGQDGLVANTAKYSLQCPIIAVNPDSSRYDGVLLPFTPENFPAAVNAVISNTFKKRIAHFAEVILNDGQRLLAFNDFFIGATSHVSARYKIHFNGKQEEHSSSGLIISTQAGTTGWLSSVFNMAYGVAGIFDKNIHRRKPLIDAEELFFAVREPFKSVRTQTEIIAGKISRKAPLILESLMPSNGVIFSDGIESDYLKFNSGTIANIVLSEATATLVIK